MERADAGEQKAAFQLFGLPWSFEGLGPSLNDPETLQRIERTVLGPAGNPVAFAANEEIKWIETAAELEAAFLSSARDTHGRRWADFADQADAIWCSIVALVWEVDERPDASSAALDDLVPRAQADFGFMRQRRCGLRAWRRGCLRAL
jgi:hypothetical protein